MNNVLNDDGLNLLFLEARTHSAWLSQPVADETLRRLYDLMRWAPTSANSNPARIVFLRTTEWSRLSLLGTWTKCGTLP
jgi:3-hydroxypropanoate dehydrogenase